MKAKVNRTKPKYAAGRDDQTEEAILKKGMDGTYAAVIPAFAGMTKVAVLRKF